ncbi:MAG: hypothetical protein K2J20_01560, partial [Bacilli bacterium]|nr:hypothetical protein [Bacilli bacterium]
IYRACSREEVDYLLDNGDIKEMGSFCCYLGCNSHKAEIGCKYLYFFLSKKAILYMCPEEGMCVCTYDIPEDVLAKYEGVGYYSDYIRGTLIISVKEFAVKSEEMKFEYLKKAELLLKDIDYRDFDDDGGIKNDLVSTIYEAKPLLKKRKKEETSIPS